MQDDAAKLRFSIGDSLLQVMLGRVYDGRMVDVWSTGCSLFVMLAGAFPFLQVRR